MQNALSAAQSRGPPTRTRPSPIRGMMPTVELYDHYWRQERVGELAVTETSPRKAVGPRPEEVADVGQAKEFRQKLRGITKP